MKTHTNISFYPISSSGVLSETPIDNSGILLSNSNVDGNNPTSIQMWAFKKGETTLPSISNYEYLVVDLNQNGDNIQTRHNAVIVEGSLSISTNSPSTPQLYSTYQFTHQLLTSTHEAGTIDSVEWEEISPTNTTNSPNFLIDLHVDYLETSRTATFKYETSHLPSSYTNFTIVAKGIYTLI